MISKYYLAVRSRTNENHAIHREGCPFLPDDEKRIYLGEFSSGQKALIAGQRQFTRTHCCLFCSNEHKKEARHMTHDAPVIIDTVLVCCLNWKCERRYAEGGTRYQTERLKSSASFITGNFNLKSDNSVIDMSADTEQSVSVPADEMIPPRGSIITDSPQ